jgi:repressor LexA
VPNDENYLAALQDYYAQHGVIPSLPAIGRLVGMSSTASVDALVKRLKLAGYLKSSPDKRLAPTPRFFQRPLFESVRAGLPQSVNDAQADTVTIDDYLVERPSTTVLVRVKGDSMIDAGIHEGDIVVVDRSIGAKVGDMVVAIVDNDFTLKTLEREKGHYILRPANPAYPVIRPQGQLEIFGVVVGQFRKYARR